MTSTTSGPSDERTRVDRVSSFRIASTTRSSSSTPATCWRRTEDSMSWIKDWRPSHFEATWLDWDAARLLNGLPRVPQLFDYEKTILTSTPPGNTGTTKTTRRTRTSRARHRAG